MYTTPEYFEKRWKYYPQDFFYVKMIVLDEVHKIFDRHSEFRKCYESLRDLHTDFPNIPIMALTATLDENQLQQLCRDFLKKPVLIKDSINRSHIKINIAKCNPKRGNKGDKRVFWSETSRQLINLIGKDHSIIYMDLRVTLS